MKMRAHSQIEIGAGKLREETAAARAARARYQPASMAKLLETGGILKQITQAKHCKRLEGQETQRDPRAPGPGIPGGFCWSTRALTIQVELLPARLMPDLSWGGTRGEAENPGLRRGIRNMILLSQFNGLMAELAEQPFNPETIDDPGSLLLVK